MLKVNVMVMIKFKVMLMVKLKVMLICKVNENRNGKSKCKIKSTLTIQ